MLGKQLISLCGSLLSWERCCSAIPPRLISGVVPSEPDPGPAAAECTPCSALVMELIPDLTDHLQDKRISVSRAIQPCFVPVLTARRALVAPPGTCPEALQQQQQLYRARLGGPPRERKRAPTPLTAVPSPAWLHPGRLHMCFQQAAGGCWPGRSRDALSATPGRASPLPPSRSGIRSVLLQDARASLCPKIQTRASH